MWNGTMFVDLDWPLNASSLLSASAELLVSFSWGIWCSPSYPFISSRLGTGSSRRHNSIMTSFATICCMTMMHVDLTRSCKLLSFFCILYLKYLIIPELMLGLMHKSQFYSVINTRWLHEWKWNNSIKKRNPSSGQLQS